MVLAMYLSIGLTTMNVILLLILSVVYYKNYMEMKAQFSLGLIMFAGILIVNKLLTLYFMLISMGDHADLLGMPTLVLESLQFISFSILSYITIR